MKRYTSGVLYDIDMDLIEESIASVRVVGEDRNAIIHGLLWVGPDGGTAFRNRGRDVRATLDGLRSLTKRYYEAALDLTTNFSVFYSELVGKKSTHADIERSLMEALRAWLKLHASSNAARQEFLKHRDLQRGIGPVDPKR
jgi:hypothetical protein